MKNYAILKSGFLKPSLQFTPREWRFAYCTLICTKCRQDLTRFIGAEWNQCEGIASRIFPHKCPTSQKDNEQSKSLMKKYRALPYKLTFFEECGLYSRIINYLSKKNI